MSNTEMQSKISAAIKADAENVITKAISFNPSVAAVVADTRKAPGKIEGVAAIALRYALRGANNAETVANMARCCGML